MEWNLAGLILASVSCPSHEPNPISVALHIRYFGSSLVLSHGFITWLLLISSLHWLIASNCVSAHLHVQVVPCRSVRIGAVLAKFGRNLDKEFTILMNACKCFSSLGSEKSKIFCTLCGSADSPSGVNICPSMSKRLVKNWHLRSYNQNCWSCRPCRTIRKASTCCL